MGAERCRATRVAAGMSVCVALLVLTLVLAQWPPFAELSATVAHDVRPRGGGWRLVRGTLRYLAIPAMLLVVVVVALLLVRTDRRAAAAFVAVTTLTNVIVQALKSLLTWLPAEVGPLSGHAGIVAGLGLGWLAAGRGSRMRGLPTSAVVGVLMLVVAGGVLLTGWHTPVQVLIPLVIGATCAVLAETVLASREPRPGQAAAIGWLAVGVTSGLLVGLVLELSGRGGSVPVGAGLALGLVTVASGIGLTIGAVVLAGTSTSRPDPVKVNGTARAN